MTIIDLNILKISQEIGISFNIIKSWWLKENFSSIDEAMSFFNINKEIINVKPIVKWVWWKRQLVSQLEKLFPKEFNNYFEPFLWGGAVFFNLQKEKSFLSDVNEELINTYKVIKENPKKLIKFLETCEYSQDFYEKIRAWDRQENWQNNFSNIERAWRFIYLNRTCFNWLHRVNSKWQFNVPMWAYKNPDFVQKQNLLNTSKLLNKTKAEIKLQSFEKVLENANFWDFIYFDPPYDTLTETANFTSYNESWFWRDMQKKLAEVFRKLDEKWCKVMLSNHNTPFIREIYTWL